MRRLPTRVRHPFRWAQCVEVADQLNATGQLHFTPGQIYWMRWGMYS